jgi:hypothetical protein
MSQISFSVRGIILTLSIIAAIGHSHPDTSLAAIQPHFSGLGRLGRDLVRRPGGEEVASSRHLNDLTPLPASA